AQAPAAHAGGLAQVGGSSPDRAASGARRGPLRSGRSRARSAEGAESRGSCSVSRSRISGRLPGIVVVVLLAAWIALLALVAGLCRTARLGDRQLGMVRNGSRERASSQASAEPAEGCAWPAPAGSRAARTAETARGAAW